MIWRVRDKGEEIAAAAPSDVFFAWFARRAKDAEVAQMDPYRSAEVTLERAALERWRTELARVRREWRAELGEELARKRRLPREPDLRRQILNGWIDAELGQHEHARMLTELEDLIELAIEADGVISAVGD